MPLNSSLSYNGIKISDYHEQRWWTEYALTAFCHYSLKWGLQMSCQEPAALIWEWNLMCNSRFLRIMCTKKSNPIIDLNTVNCNVLSDYAPWCILLISFRLWIHVIVIIDSQKMLTLEQIQTVMLYMARTIS